MSKLKLLIGIIIVYLLMSPVNISAELSNYQYNIIQVAFMNGFVHAIKLDINTIKILKKNKEKLKAFSQIEVKKYMEEVTRLNSSNPKGKSKLKLPAYGSGSVPH